MLAIAAAIGLSACGGGGDEPAAGEFADGACVDRASATGGSGIAGAASASNPTVVDCDSPEAAGTLKKVTSVDECPEGSGIGVFSVGQSGEDVTDGAFCIEPD